MPEPHTTLHTVLNEMTVADARAALTRCCGSSRWVDTMLARRPFASSAALHAEAEAVWRGLEPADFLEAFAHHPRIGAQGRDGDGDGWSRQEQARVGDADAETRRALAAANETYLQRFGYIFIVCATGKSAAEMLGLLEARLRNDSDRELRIAADEHARITRLRLERLAS